MKIKMSVRCIVIALTFLLFYFSQTHAQTHVNIMVVNLPPAFDGEELALAGTLNNWNNNLSVSMVENDTISYTFFDIDITPLDPGWLNTPDGANAAFSFFDPGSWYQRISGNYGSNDNNFRVALTGDTTNTLIIDAQFSLTNPPQLTIDIGQPSIIVNGEPQFPQQSIADVTISVINLPDEFNGDELSIAGTVNNWDNSISVSTVVNNTLTYVFHDIIISPLGAAWSNKPEGANTAFSFFEPGTWNQIIVGNYGSNDNNFRVALENDMMNTVEIDAQYSLTTPPWLIIDIEQPSVLVNGEVQIPPPVITNATITVTNLPADFEGQAIGLVGSVVPDGIEMLEATVEGNVVSFGIEGLELSLLGPEWTACPLDANATFVFVDPQTMENVIAGNYYNNNDYFRVRLASNMNNTVAVDAVHQVATSPLTIDRNKGIQVDGNLQRPNQSIDPTRFAWPGGKWKALIMSYDDGPLADTQMINLFNSSGIIGTFSLTSGFINTQGFVTGAQVSSIYVNHEVANHSEHHPYLGQGDTTSIRSEIENCSNMLSSLVGYEINGMAYPFGGAGTGAYDYRVIEIAQNLGIRYSRTTNDTKSLEIPEDFPDGLMQWDPTTNDWDGITYANQLLDWNQDRMALLYMWGHSHFLDEEGWAKMTTICQLLGNRDDIWYAKNIEVADYLRTINNLIIEDSTVHNPSNDIPIWIVTEDGLTELGPGETIIADLSNSTLEDDKRYTELFQNYPNPADLSTTIDFNILDNRHINLALFDLQGRFVQTVLDTKLQQGTYQVKLDTSKLESGVYIYQLNNSLSQTSKLLMVVH